MLGTGRHHIGIRIKEGAKGGRMRREKAIITALKIIKECRKHSGGDCTQCPFNVKGCIATNGDNIPTDWRAGSLIYDLEELD